MRDKGLSSLLDHAPQNPLYHGAQADFEKPKLNGQGILWLAFTPKVALDYATPHYHKGDSYLWEVKLKGGAKIIDLGDLSDPIIQELRQGVISPITNQPISEASWPSYADFGILEAKRWVRGFLRKKRVDGIVVKDSLGTTAIQHDSVALINLGAIAKLDKRVVPAGSAPSNRTIQEIENDLRTASERVAHRFLVASFKPGDYILFGKFRNKRARIIRLFNDERGIPYIEVQPIPKGRKSNRIFGLYTIRQMTPEAIQETQQLEAAERALVQKVAARYLEATRMPPGWVEHKGSAGRSFWISPDGKAEISDTGRKGGPQRFQVFFLQNGKRHEDIGWPSLKKALQYLSGEVGLRAHPMAKRKGGNLDNFLDGFSRRHPRLGRLLPKVVEKAQGSSSGHGEARQHGQEIWLFPKFWDLDLKIQDFVLAHEIGHYVQSQKPGTWLMNLGKEQGVDVWDTRSLPFGQFNQDEAFADSFASYFLEPGELRRRYPAWVIFVEAAL